MACIAPSANLWREQMPDWDDSYVSSELRRAWVDGKGYISRNRGVTRVYHDWTGFRAATLREARLRHLDLSVVPARVLGT